ncbi:hypothetical protein JM47_02665 [Ureaplasma diversum]|uniref:Uncharacterized protein n=1 Tax=Ureaplasma diversum TaxID=42094 RepID=A0A0C5RQ04_9BACT|nr:hypothetical protein [Ureaplasma diversum]AJQ45459.1 hypothetical protein JM47_02665 [Ureaplasma diversum]
MSKFKNKKALALSVGAIMAGVSVIGVAAACAPTKAKPNKPSQGTQNPSQSGGTESTNPGSGNTTAPSGQGSENNTTNPSAGSTNTNPGATNTNPGATNPESGTKQEDPKTANPNNQAQPENPNNSGGDTNSKSDSKTEENNPSVGSGSNQEMKDDKTPNLGSKPSEDSMGSDQKGEKHGGTNDQNPSENQKVDPSSPGSGEKPDMQAESPKENDDSSSKQNEGKKGTEAPQDPNTESSSPQADENVKPAATASLDPNAKLTESNGDFVLPLKFQNANKKFVEVELVDNSNDETVIKSDKVEVKNNEATFKFEGIKLISKYKFKSIKLFDEINSNTSQTIKLSDELSQRIIDVNNMVLELAGFKRDAQKYPEITLKVSTKLFSQFDGKQFGFKIENNKRETEAATYFATVGPTKIWTRKLGESNGKTTFLIFTDFKYENEQGASNWYIKNLWFGNDTQKNNLLKDTIEFKS